ncbi:Imm49 family immunity protein [Sorangium sp. So ce394]|uniref:Imm49 family immunity protein n=1 Tax=Sorangium sp. So ce394 TaxID=3133310 RepID=UPI003F5B4DE7
MASKFLRAYMSNAHHDCEQMLPAAMAHRLTFKQALRFSQQYRIIAIGALFLYMDASAFQLYLYKSGRSFAHYVQIGRESEQVPSRCRPLFDAVAALDLDGARDIARRIQTSRSDAEYEEDFLYVTFIRSWLLGRAHEEGTGLLERYEVVLEGADDPRLDLCRALLRRDGSLFDEALRRFLEQVEARYLRLARTESITDEELATEGRLSVEGLALVTLAESAGMNTSSDYLMVPSAARARSAPTASPETWQVVGS